MCGFFLKYSLSGIIIHHHSEKFAASLMEHRGPDAVCEYRNDQVWIWFCRLSIIDTSPAGNQPMSSKCGRYQIVFNGEIYNFRELAKQHSLTDLESHSDTEVLLALYILLGEKVLEVIRGMYSFIIYDNKTKSLFGARDQFGIKPLYYVNNNDSFIFSSEIKPLLRIKKNTTINQNAVRMYLVTGAVDNGEETFINEIMQVPASSFFIADKNGIHIRRKDFFNLIPPTNTENEYQEAYLQLLIEKIKLYLYADVPVGISLSGGFDSSFLGYLIYHGGAGKSLKMFTRGYANYEGNEFTSARAVANRFNLEHHTVELNPEEVPHLLSEYSRIQEHPVTSISILTFHKLYSYVNSLGLKVLIEGHGGDEIWAGYNYYLSQIGPDHGSKNVYPAHLTHSQDGSVLDMNYSLLRDGKGYAQYVDRDLEGFDLRGISMLTKAQLQDIYGGKMQRSLRFVDRASMSKHIEVRLPFLDFDVVSDALRIPDSWKVGRFGLRSFIRGIAQKSLGEIALRPKVPIQDPQRKWMQNEIKPYIKDTLNSASLFIGEYIDIQRLRNEYDKFLCMPSQFQNLTFVMYPLFLEAWYNAMKDFLNTGAMR